VVDAVGRWVVSATIVVVLLVTATGRDGGHMPGADGAGLNVTQMMVWAGFVLFVVGVAVTVVRARPRPRGMPERENPSEPALEMTR
jgi:preprotein translocase subunit SecG